MISYFPENDFRHLKKELLNAKSLGTLARIEDSANPTKQEEFVSSYTNKFPFHYTKEAKKAAKDKTPVEILNYAGIQTKQLSDGSTALTAYHQPSIKYSYRDIGVNEQELIKGVSTVYGCLNLQNTSLNTTGEISSVHGDISLDKKSALKDLSSIKNLYGCVLIRCDDKDEAMKLLKRLKFRPDCFTGKIILLPEKF